MNGGRSRLSEFEMSTIQPEDSYPVGYPEINRQLLIAEDYRDRFRKISFTLCLLIPSAVGIIVGAWLLPVVILIALTISLFGAGLAAFYIRQWWQIGTLHLTSVKDIIEPLRERWHIIAHGQGWRDSAYAEQVQFRLGQFQIATEDDDWGSGFGSLLTRLEWMAQLLKSRKYVQ